MQTAIATAIRQWHEATRTYEQIQLAFADAQTQLNRAERDLHELAKAVEMITGAPIAVQSNTAAPAGTVTMPIVATPPINAAVDNMDASEVVLQEMQRMRGIAP